MDVLAGLNPAQQEAVLESYGALVIPTGPGSGKTRVITHRIANLVRNVGVPPWRILAVTFTNKAARELRERVEGLIGERPARAMTLATFHSWCARILRDSGVPVGVDPRFTIYDDDDQIRLIKRALLDISADPKQYNPRVVLSLISKSKNEMISAAEYARRAEDYFEETVARAYARYQEVLNENRALDFDDLLLRTAELFADHASVRIDYQQKYDFIMIDEFQDTNVVQYRLARLLTHPEHGGNGNICVVGDRDQSIYAWRSARPGNFDDFEIDFPSVKKIELRQNYRSTQTILDASMAVLQNPEKGLWTENGYGGPIVLYEAEDADSEARFIRNEIQSAVRTGARRPRDFAVMYRTNAQSRAIEDAMSTSGVRYRIVGGVRFWERQEIKDLVAYLRLAQNPYDGVSMLRVINVPGRKIGKTTVDRLQDLASARRQPLYDTLQAIAAGGAAEVGGPARMALTRFVAILRDMVEAAPGLTPPELIQWVIDQTGYKSYLNDAFDNGDERWENVQQLIVAARQYEEIDPAGALTAFLENAALVSDADEIDERADAVTLITLHAAKGLEFPVVFIAGMEEAVLPHIRSFDNPEQMEEERRLCYVGMTRAKEQLYLSYARYRQSYGGGQHNPPSRFIADVPERLTETRTGERVYGGRPNAHQRGAGSPWQMAIPALAPPAPTRVPAAAGAPRAERAATSSFQPGQLVRHDKFGEGVVVGCRASGDDTLVEVQFKGGVGIKKLMASFAGLQRA